MYESREKDDSDGEKSLEIRDPAAFDRGNATVSSLAMENASNYFQWQFNVLSSHLTPRLLEIGCGIGGFTRTLLDRKSVV